MQKGTQVLQQNEIHTHHRTLKLKYKSHSVSFKLFPFLSPFLNVLLTYKHYRPDLSWLPVSSYPGNSERCRAESIVPANRITQDVI